MECTTKKTRDGKLFLVLMAQSDTDMKIINVLRQELRNLDHNDHKENQMKKVENEHNIVVPLIALQKVDMSHSLSA